MRERTSFSRRSLLRGLGVALPASAFLDARGDPRLDAALAAIRAQSAADGDAEPFWDFLRKQFMLERGLIYLNAGTTGAMPRPVFEAEARYQRMLAENPKVRGLFERQVAEKVRRKAARWIGGDLEETALTHNTTEGLNIVAHGLPLKAGDQILITDQEHPAAREPWRLRAKRDSIDVTEVKIPVPLPDTATFLNLFERTITSRTRVIAVPHIPTTTGTIFAAREISALARARGIWTLLDGAHCAGQIRVDVKQLGCDFYATSPHKWLHAPLGNGIFYVRRELQKTLWPLVGHGGWDTYPDARRYTTFGNRSWATAVALGDAIDFAAAIGIEEMEARQRSLMTEFRRRLLALPGVEPLNPDDPKLRCGQSAFRFARVSAHQLATYLREEHRIVVAEKSDNGLRIDIAYFVAPRELEKTVEIIDHVIRKGLFRT